MSRGTGRWVALAGALVVGGGLGWLLLRESGEPEGVGGGAREEAAGRSRSGDEPGLARSPGAYAPGVAGENRIVGRVVEGGRPVGGVRVVARDTKDWKLVREPGVVTVTAAHVLAHVDERMADPGGGVPPDVAEAVSDADGAFTLRVPRPGAYLVQAVAEPPRIGPPGWAQVSASGDPPFVLVTVSSGSRLEGRVEGAGGRPVAATVEAHGPPEPFLAPWTDAVDSDPATGAFAFPGVPLGDVRLTVVRPGLRVAGFEVRTPHEGTYVIRLAESGSVRGLVSDSQARPVAGAKVLVTTRAAGADGPGASSQGFGTSGPDGRYRVDGLLPGFVTHVAAAAPGHAFHANDGARQALPALAAGAEAVVDVRLAKGCSVTGRVVEEGSGRPLAGVRVSARPVAARGWRPPPPAAETGAEGRYRIEGLEAGPWIVLASAPGHHVAAAYAGTPAGAGREPPPPEVCVVLAAEGDEAERDFALRPGTPVRGRVLDPAGAPASGAVVRVVERGTALPYQSWGVHLEGPPEVRSGGDGAFEIPGLPPRAEWTLVARKAPHGPAYSSLRVGAEPVEGVVLSLASGASLAGRVVDERDAGVAGAEVTWLDAYGDPVSRRTDVDGSFLFESLAIGDGRVAANGSGRSARVEVVGLAAGERRTGLVLRLAAVSRPLSGTIVDSRGVPVVQRTVFAVAVGEPRRRNAGRTDAEGRFRVPRDERRYSIEVADASGRTTHLGFAEPGVDDLRFTWDPPAARAVRGTVVDPEGVPVPWASATVVPSGAPQVGTQVTTTVLDGRFEVLVEHEPPWDVTVSSPRDERGRPQNLLGARATAVDEEPLRIVLGAGNEIRGRIVDPDGAGVGDVPVVAEPEARGPTRGAVARSGPDGGFVLRGLEAGEFSLTAHPPERFATPEPLRVEAGSADVVVALRIGASVEGRVVGPDGGPVRGVYLSVSWAEGTARRQSNAVVRPDGSFRATGFPPDARVDLRAQTGISEDLRPAVRTGVPSGATGVVLTLERGAEVSGVVVSTDGEPQPGLSVVYLTAPGVLRVVDTDASGRFALHALPLGRLELSVEDRGEKLASALVDAPATDVRVVVEARPTIRGRLQGVGPLGGFVVVARPGGAGAVSHVESQADGSFAAKVRTTGPHVLVARREGDDRYGVAEGVVPGPDAVVVPLRPGLSIAGRLEGFDVAGDLVVSVASTTGPTFLVSEQPDAEGRFRVRALAPGRYRVSAFGDPGTPRPSVEVDAGAQDVVLTAGR